MALLRRMTSVAANSAAVNGGHTAADRANETPLRRYHMFG